MEISHNPTQPRRQNRRCPLNQLKNQVAKLALFTLITVVVAAITISNRVSYESEEYFLVNKLINKNAVGIFPPLQGNYEYFYGSWEILINLSAPNETFDEYLLTFYPEKILTIHKQVENCTKTQSQHDYLWETFSFNIKIAEKPKKQNNLIPQVTKQTEEQETCFEQDEKILQYMQDSSAWTFVDENLYLMSQSTVDDVSGAILVLRHAYE